MQIVPGMVAVTLAACSAPTGGVVLTPDASGPDATAIVDLDQDGLDDARELQLAADYEPFISLDPGDGCPLDGLLVRVRPHPADPTKIVITYDQLFEHDCGLNGHVGDDEAFGVAIDPSLPPPAGILAIIAISHQGTVCEHDTECSTCGDSRTACDLSPDGTPVVYPSKDKHGHYATLATCNPVTTCLDSCSLAPAPDRPPIVNAGEPDHPLTRDLTDDGFIAAALGWTEPDLLHFDPWDPTKDFGGAGNIAGDLQDEAFTPALCP